MSYQDYGSTHRRWSSRRRRRSNPTNHKFDLYSSTGLFKVIQDAYEKNIEEMYPILTRMNVFYGTNDQDRAQQECKFCRHYFAMYYLTPGPDNLPMLLEHLIYHMPPVIQCRPRSYEYRGYMAIFGNEGPPRQLRIPRWPVTGYFQDNFTFARHIVASLAAAYSSGGDLYEYSIIRHMLRFYPEHVTTILVLNYVSNPYYRNGVAMTLQQACVREICKPFVLRVLYHYIRNSNWLYHKNKKTTPCYKNMNVTGSIFEIL